jgi:hypothetical protein
MPRWQVWRMRREVRKILAKHAQLKLTTKQTT